MIFRNAAIAIFLTQNQQRWRSSELITSLDLKNNISDDPTSFNQIMGFGDLRKRQAGCNIMDQAISFQQHRQISDGAFANIRIQAIHDEKNTYGRPSESQEKTAH